MDRWDGTSGTNAMIGTTNGTSGWKWTNDGKGRNWMEGWAKNKQEVKHEINGN